MRARATAGVPERRATWRAGEIRGGGAGSSGAGAGVTGVSAVASVPVRWAAFRFLLFWLRAFARARSFRPTEGRGTLPVSAGFPPSADRRAEGERAAGVALRRAAGVGGAEDSRAIGAAASSPPSP